MDNEEKGDKVITILRKSRKAFIIEYVCSFLLLGLLGATYIKGIALARPFTYLILGIAAFALLSAEWSRAIVWYKITESKVVIIKGIFKQTKKNVHFLPLGYVPEINTHQGRIQRLLNIGTIFVHGSTQNSFEIKDINEPQQVLALIERLIDENRRKQR